jgi:hypothetical protein
MQDLCFATEILHEFIVIDVCHFCTLDRVKGKTGLVIPIFKHSHICLQEHNGDVKWDNCLHLTERTHRERNSISSSK